MTGIVDGNGNTVVEYRYDAWGKLLSTTGSLASTIGKANPFLYRGYYYDSETGLYYLNSRYYDPQTGRFVSEDGQLNPDTGLAGNNLFVYCNNNPVNMSDYNGARFTEYDDGAGQWVYTSSSGKVFQGSTHVPSFDTKSPPPPSVGYTPPKNPDKAKQKVPAPGARGETGWLDKKETSGFQILLWMVERVGEDIFLTVSTTMYIPMVMLGVTIFLFFICLHRNHYKRFLKV